jgi:hypothetical protein
MASIHTSNFGIIQSHLDGAPLKVKLVIHNQCPGIELVSPVYGGDSITCYISPDQRVDAGSKMQVGFSIHPAREESIGIFMYKLQKKKTDQSNEDIMSSEVETICTQLVFVWKVYKLGKFRIFSDLIEHDKRRVWDRDNMMKLAESYRLYDIKRNPVEHTWLTHDNAELMTSLNVTRKKTYYKLEMTVSKGSINDGTWKPRYIGLNG